MYTRREPEKTALYQVMQRHLLTFEQEWTDEASGRTLPKFVTDELHGFMSCGILGRGFAHLLCKTGRDYHAVAFSCKARAVCPYIPFYLGGEGKLSLGRAIRFARQGAALVVNCAPFGCMPETVATAIYGRLSAD